MESTTNPIAGQAADALTPTERTRLRDCETRIARGVTVFVDVARALIEVRDAKLFRQEYATFSDYCQQRWGFSDSRARQLIAAAMTAKRVETVTTVTVPNEAVARELNRAAEDRQPEVWQQAVQKANGTPTAAVVREVVAQTSENATTEPAHEPGVTCPHCHSHEVDQDGDCRVCREPHVAAAAEPTARRTIVTPIGTTPGSPEWIQVKIKLAKAWSDRSVRDVRELVKYLGDLRAHDWTVIEGAPKDWDRFCVDFIGHDPAFLAEMEAGVRILERQEPAR